ncbi:winged helix-turn-helix transcriptional regulator [Microbacterium sp. NIBRBAC000506063]|nr:winged helix-turn-helix transcriptional regulator [Microbacterium sp. NIBRBAC000506063]
MARPHQHRRTAARRPRRAAPARRAADPLRVHGARHAPAERLSAPGDLAAATNATLPRASKVISRMRQRGLVERLTASDDRRAVDVTITTAGRRALVLATPGHLDTVRELVLDHLDATQLDALANALEPVVAALDPHERFNPQRAKD